MSRVVQIRVLVGKAGETERGLRKRYTHDLAWDLRRVKEEGAEMGLVDCGSVSEAHRLKAVSSKPLRWLQLVPNQLPSELS